MSTHSLHSLHSTLRSKRASLFIPDANAAAKITHVGIGAHQDDLEFHALHAILECWGRHSFAGITCTDGAGSSRTGIYEKVTDEEMRVIRHQEQNAAAAIGKYGAMVQLGYSSAETRDPKNSSLTDDLSSLLRQLRPRVVHTHNLIDSHRTHVAVALHTVEAIRRLPSDQRPDQLIGFEGWRSLDWLSERDKLQLDVSSNENLSAALAGVFDSQISGGKRYDLALPGRRAANATMSNAYSPDKATKITYAMDMTPLIRDEALEPENFALKFIQNFEQDVRQCIRDLCQGPISSDNELIPSRAGDAGTTRPR